MSDEYFRTTGIRIAEGRDVCVLASLIPGLRATGVEPVEALAAE